MRIVIKIFTCFQKIRLLGFEKNFDDKIQEIDEKYQAQMHELMTQNSEIR